MFPLGESSRLRGPKGSARRMCAEDAIPPSSSILEIAADTEADSRQIRKITWIGSLLESVGLARMALRLVPTDAELNPILPTIPAYDETVK